MGWEDDLSAGTGMFQAWDMEIEFTEVTELRAHRHLPSFETQDGTDIREYKNM